MKLNISTGDIDVSLGESFDSVCPKLGTLELGLYVDAPRKSVTIKEEGISFNFNSNKLSTVFLYLAHDEIAPYQGSVTYLPMGFWENPTEDNFIATLSESGFQRWARAYPNAVDMVSDALRFRLTDRNNRRVISIDDGSMIKG